MSASFPTLDEILTKQGVGEELAEVMRTIAGTCAQISEMVAGAGLEGALGLAGAVNVQDEEQKALDVMTDELMSAALGACDPVAGLASEEQEAMVATGRKGGYLVAFDPLDGSSNIDVNVSVGTIFSVLPAPEGRAPTEADFMVGGRAQIAAGYAIYGPQTMLVLTLGGEVQGFSLTPEGDWLLTHGDIKVPRATKEFAINMSNRRHWAPGIRAYIDDCLAGVEGPRGKNFNMRWVASMVADVHRILMRGGVFLYPWDAREPDRAGKLRLLYEGNPMSLLIERAGGKATNVEQPILDVKVTGLHQRVAVVLGSAEEVELASAAK
ncbi:MULTISPECIES: class 1 fructose-bisphosphatase [Phenylobacterium]|uniref:Fructose-1,6-bisphosphatase class 1 n=1 Tax=Phenylobacterium koreense TaxID=266125 RepID=A0ABV2EIX2_9CAUL